jgi:hypothetical protein
VHATRATHAPLRRNLVALVLHQASRDRDELVVNLRVVQLQVGGLAIEFLQHKVLARRHVLRQRVLHQRHDVLQQQQRLRHQRQVLVRDLLE